MSRRRRAFSIVELIVVIAIIAILIAIVVPVVHRARLHAQRSTCAAHLQQLAVAFAGYASENRGVLPRSSADYVESHGPVWITAIVPQLNIKKNASWTDISAAGVLQCPSHPTHNIPSAFVLNCFAFETGEGNWSAAPPVKLGQPKNPASLPWLLETPDLFHTQNFAQIFYDDIFFEPEHVVYSPRHLPGGDLCRINDSRHVAATSNVLYFDGHVAAVHQGELQLAQFDDGIRNRISR